MTVSRPADMTASDCVRDDPVLADDVDVVGEAAGGGAAITSACDTVPNAIPMDVRMPVLDGPGGLTGAAERVRLAR